MHEITPRAFRLRPLQGAVLLALLAKPAAAADGLALGVGVDYSSGAYGESIDTEILFVPVFLKWEKDPWSVKLSVPYVQMRGPGRIVLNGEKPITAEDESPTVTTQSGLGDVTLGVTRTAWVSDGGHLGADVTAKIKFPTAEAAKGLGTGKADYALLVDVYGALSGLSLFAGAGHRWMGQPAGVHYRDVWSANGGLSYKLAGAISAGAMYDYRQSVYATQPGASEITPFVSFKLGMHAKLQWYGTFGLSEGSPDWGMGLVLQRSY